MRFDIAVFGSAFDPCHAGHLDAMQQALTQSQIVLAVPSVDHPFGKRMAPLGARSEVIRACLQASTFDGDRVIISDVEQTLYKARPGPVYTYAVLEEISKQHPGARIAFVMGPDNAAPKVWQSFYRADEIEKRWAIIVTEERVNIRSTELRDQIRQGHNVSPIYLCSEAQKIIRENNLYRGGKYAA